MRIDATDRLLVSVTQAGLPLVPQPYAQIAEDLGLDQRDVCSRLQRMQDNGVIRRIAVAPNHYALGMTANGMSVWDVEDARIADLGAQIGALEFVSHCYERPRALPEWPYNLFAMIHGATREEVEEKRGVIRVLLGEACQGCDILYSTRILKKTGLRLRRKEG